MTAMIGGWGIVGDYGVMFIGQQKEEIRKDNLETLVWPLPMVIEKHYV